MLLAKAFVKQAQQEEAIEGLKLPFAFAILHLTQTVAEIVAVAVEKTLFLNEVHEHQPVEHQGCVPLGVALLLHPFDEGEKGSVFPLEVVVEPLRETIAIERIAELEDRASQVNRFFFRKGNCDRTQLLNQQVARLTAGVIRMLAVGGGHSGLPSDPLPNLSRLGVIDENDEVLEGRLRDFFLDLPAEVVIGNGSIRSVAGEDSNATLVRNPGEFEDDSIDFDLEPRTGEVPAEFLREERRKIKLLQSLADGG